MRYLMIVLALAGAAPAAAQQSTEPSAPVADPARFAAAQRIIDLVWPVGTFRRVMESSMQATVDSSLESVLGMRIGDNPPASAAAGSADANARLRERAGAADPHFRERYRITMDVMMKDMTEILSAFEPQVRRTMASIYARRFTESELNELNLFFSTPTGRRYASEAIAMMNDPELNAAMQSFTPRLVQAMPGIAEKVKKATAHLPPPPVRSGRDGS